MFVHKNKLFKICKKMLRIHCRNVSCDLSVKKFVWNEPTGYRTNLKVYNPLTKSKVELITRKEKLLSWYSCGPTVYDSPHIGHACCYMQYDLIRRILEQFYNINIVMVMGVTDIDDKIISRANVLNLNVTEVSKKYEKEFFDNLAALNIKPPTVRARVSDYIKEIISFVDVIVKNGYGYVMPDGTVNFSVDKFQLYGKLVPAQEESDSNMDKESSRDFAMWKGAKPGEPSWESPWGPGRPGWHIECSAIASTLLGSRIDIHTGGIDLKFPHHENEEAQCCAHHNTDQWINYWLHTGHLFLSPEVKMSKSLKNTISIDEFLTQYTPNQLRMLCMLIPYRNGIEYNDEIMGNALATEKKFINFLNDSASYVRGESENSSVDESLLLEELEKTRTNVLSSLGNDFDTGSAITHLIKLITKTNSMLRTETKSTVQETSSYAVLAVANYIKNCLYQFGFESSVESSSESYLLPDVVQSAVEFRSKIREIALQINKTSSKESKENKSVLLEACDFFRNNLMDSGIELKDHGKKTIWNIQKTTKS